MKEKLYELLEENGKEINEDKWLIIKMLFKNQH